MYRQAVSEDLNSSLLDLARRGYFGLLRRKRMSRQFVEREGEELFALACVEYSRHLAEGREIRDPVAWIIVCAWHRTVDVLRSRDWTPQMVSTERIGELSAKSRPAPEEEVLIEDRYRKLRDAVERLPTYQRQLVALSYFEGMSVRDAARELGWTPSKAQRAHDAARRRLRKLLPVERMDDLEIVGLVTFLIFEGERACSSKLQLIGGFEGAIDAVAHRSSQLGDRVLDLIQRPFSHIGSGGRSRSDRGAEVTELGHRMTTAADLHGPVALLTRGGRRVSEAGRRLATSNAMETTAAAADGGSRVVETCKALAVACLIGGGAVTGALVASERHDESGQRSHPSAAASARIRKEAPADPRVRAADPRATRAVASPSPSQAQPRSAAAGTEATAPSQRQQVAQPTAAARRAQQRQDQEEAAVAEFGPEQQIQTESSGSSSTGPTSGALSSTEPSPSTSGGGGGESSRPPPSARVKAEEGTAEKQIRGGLEGLK